MVDQSPNIIALGVEYDGSAFHGFQSQRGVETVQDRLEHALAVVADCQVRVAPAGRTDAGVHATQQVVSFKFSGRRPERAWIRGVNSHLPNACAVLWAHVAPIEFHARFSAVWRRYVYVFGERDPHPAIGRDLATWVHSRLDDAAMHEAGQSLIGEHDFTSFRGAGCQSTTPVRRVHSLQVIRKGHFVYIDIVANAFLLHMVRNIAGALLAVGYGHDAPSLIRDGLRGMDRSRMPPTAPAQGLYFVHVGYPELSVGREPRTPAILGPLVLD